MNPEVINEYKKIEHLNIKAEDPTEYEWKYHIKEEHQTLEKFTNSIHIKKNATVMFYVDVTDKYCYETIISWLNIVFNIEIKIKTIDTTKAPSDLWKVVVKKGIKAALVSPLVYGFTRYLQKRVYEDKIQYSGNVILSSLEIDNKFIIATDKDIYDNDTRFVFGLSEIDGNGTLVSNYRLQDLTPKEKLIALLKIFTHEFSHNVGLEHCTENKCVVQGFLSLEELNAMPLLPCLEDCAKIAHFCGRTLKEQIQSILIACEKLGVTNIVEQEYNMYHCALNKF